MKIEHRKWTMDVQVTLLGSYTARPTCFPPDGVQVEGVKEAVRLATPIFMYYKLGKMGGC